MPLRLILALGLIAGCSPQAPPPLTPKQPESLPANDMLKALADRDFDRATNLASGILATHPDDPQSLYFSILATQGKAFQAEKDTRWPIFHDSARLARRLREVQKRPTANDVRAEAQAFYNEACAFAQTGQPDKALSVLLEAVELGLENSSLFQSDEDLKPLRDRPEFAMLQHLASLKGAARLLAINRPIPFEFRLPDAQGRTTSLDDFKGKVVVVNFWASWSPPCRREAAFLADLYRKDHEHGLEIVGLNDQEDEKAVAAFLEEFPAPYIQLRGDEATRKQVPQFAGYPTTILVDRLGRVRLILAGFGDGERAAIDDAVTILLDEK